MVPAALNAKMGHRPIVVASTAVLSIRGSSVPSRPRAIPMLTFYERLRVDAGLMLIVQASITLWQPFTLQCARDRRSRALGWPAFRAHQLHNQRCTAFAFGILVLADIMMIYILALSYSAGVTATGDLGDFAARSDAGLWILEIQLAHPIRAFGAFYEDRLA